MSALRILSRTVAAGTVLGLALTIGLAGCASSSSTTGTNQPSSTAEANPSGDIPDNQAYVSYRPADGLFTLTIPEGWAQASTGASTTFTDKLNSATIDEAAATSAPTVAAVQATVVPKLAAARKGFTLTDVTQFTRKGGSGVLIRYQQDAPTNSVTTAGGRQAVESYLFYKAGHEVVVTLTSPRGADNVDPWKKITESFAWM
jgi:hypothetical protein